MDSIEKFKQAKEEKKKIKQKDKFAEQIKKKQEQDKKNTIKQIKNNKEKQQVLLSEEGQKRKKKSSSGSKSKGRKKRVKSFTTGDACLRKYHRGEKLYKKEEDTLKKYLINKADSLCSKYIKRRDSKFGKESRILCVTHQALGCMGTVDIDSKQCNNCHWIGRERYSHRWKLFNCNSGCVSCNAHHKESHKQEYDAVMIKRHGLENYEKRWYGKNKIKPSIEDLLDIVNIFEQLLTGELTESEIDCERI